MTLSRVARLIVRIGFQSIGERIATNVVGVIVLSILGLLFLVLVFCYHACQRFLVALALLALAGCAAEGLTKTAPDAAPLPVAAPHRAAATLDAGAPLDTRVLPDLAGSPDAGVPPDVRVLVDTGAPSDAGLPSCGYSRVIVSDCGTFSGWHCEATSDVAGTPCALASLSRIYVASCDLCPSVRP